MGISATETNTVSLVCAPDLFEVRYDRLEHTRKQTA